MGLISTLLLSSMPASSFGSPEVSQAPPSGLGSAGDVTYDLATSIRNTLEKSGALQIATRTAEIDRKRGDEAAAAGRPNVAASASATRDDQQTAVRFTPQSPPVVVRKSHSEILSVNVGQRLDITGQIRAASDQARLQILADEFTRDQIHNSLILQVKREYYDLLRAEHQLQVAQSALETARQQQALAQKLFSAEIGQKIDLLRANTEVANSEQGLFRAQNQLGMAQAAFNRLTGIPLLTATRVQDVLGVTVGVDVPATAVETPSVGPLFSVSPAEVNTVGVDQDVQAALAQRPEILTEQVNVRAQQVGIKLAQSGREPTATVDARGNAFPTTSFQFPRRRTADITAAVTVPLYDAGATRNRVEESRLLTENAQTRLQSRQASVSLEVRSAYMNLLTAASQIDNANAALRQAVAARQLAQIRYSGQVGLYLEVTDAQAALVQAEDAQVNAIYDYLIARAQLENAVGAPKTD